MRSESPLSRAVWASKNVDKEPGKQRAGRASQGGQHAEATGAFEKQTYFLLANPEAAAEKAEQRETRGGSCVSVRSLGHMTRKR